MVQLNETEVNLITNPVISYINMLGSAVVHLVLSHITSTLVINVHWNRCTDSENLVDYVVHPYI